MTDFPLRLPHAFVLLELEESSGKSLLRPHISDLALSGAFYAELVFSNRLMCPSANRFTLSSVGKSTGLMQLAEKLLPRGLFTHRQAIASLAVREESLRYEVLAELVAMGCLRMEVDEIFQIPYQWRWPNADFRVEQTVRNHLQSWLEKVTEEPPGREDALLSLLRVTKLLSVVWSDAELEVLGPKIQKRTKRVPIGRTVKREIGSQQVEYSVRIVTDILSMLGQMSVNL